MIKYNFINQEILITNINRLTNQLWKLIPMREHEEDWGKQLNTVLIEVAGLGEIIPAQPSLLELIAKLEGLNKISTEFDFYRKTIFECIALIQGLKHEQLS